MTAAGQVRSEIVSRLKAAGLDAAEAYEDERFRERSGSVVAVGAKQAELAHAGLMNYLGEQYDAESGRTVEVYGRKLKMAASLDVYAPRRKGARGCEQTAEAVSEALLDGLADGLTLDELSWEKTEWDEEYGMFVRRGTARCTAYFVATALAGLAAVLDALAGFSAGHSLTEFQDQSHLSTFMAQAVRSATEASRSSLCAISMTW